ncbi:MAG: hypothetical protein QUU85_12850, partial [Candidatus Eisenbacteria bacterium]|nr:hypothetical protein [Candidatus Eisenbacteria bacterium]
MPVGFLLHPTYRIEKGLPIVHLFGKLETGESFVLRDTRARPHFFIEEADLERASALLGRSVSIETVPLRTMQG